MVMDWLEKFYADYKFQSSHYKKKTEELESSAHIETKSKTTFHLLVCLIEFRRWNNISKFIRTFLEETRKRGNLLVEFLFYGENQECLVFEILQ